MLDSTELDEVRMLSAAWLPVIGRFNTSTKDSLACASCLYSDMRRWHSVPSRLTPSHSSHVCLLTICEIMF